MALSPLARFLPPIPQQLIDDTNAYLADADVTASEINKVYIEYLIEGDPAPEEFLCASCDGLLISPMK